MFDQITHVRSQISLQASKLNPIEKNQGIFVCCPFHSGGRERTPSCKINLTGTQAPVGYYYCFGACRGTDIGKGSWNKFAEATGLAGFKAADQLIDVYSFSVKDETARKREDLEDYEELKFWHKEYGERNWRKIEPATIKLFGGRVTEDDRYYRDYRLYFPVLIGKEYVGGIYARITMTPQLKKAGAISYINTKGRWSKTSVFGYNIARKRRGPLWIVEGPRDALKVTQLGGRAVATIGSYFGEDKARLIEMIDPSKIIIATDPDPAGKKLRRSIKELCSKFPIYDVRFPEDKDPANLTPRIYQHYLDKLGIKNVVN